jgi:hypothetical protein
VDFAAAGELGSELGFFQAEGYPWFDPDFHRRTSPEATRQENVSQRRQATRVVFILSACLAMQKFCDGSRTLQPLVQLRFPHARIPVQNCRTGHRAYNDYCFISFCALSQVETCFSDSSFEMP